MDPQQRMFLEVAWQALEDAAQSPAELAGSDTGVFAGVCSNDYAMLYGGDLRMIGGEYGTGAASSIVANRVSYVLDLKGPSETVDSACSSALVAVHHACQALRNGECDVAIAGGVNAVLAPEASIYFSQLRALAPDGRCKAFDERADGLVRSEGAGAVVLKRLSRALADGDRVYALIAGSAVKHDGRSNGLAAPSGNAQRDVVRRALEAAAITPSDLDYVEAHGVGTKVADTVELHALGAVMEGREPERPLLVGSAKTNVGHLEAASGMVGLIKVALALVQQEIPAHLHLQRVHPDIARESLPLAIPTAPTPWRRGARPRLAGVSAFGFGGTNAHVVVREAPPRAHTVRKKDRPCHVLTLSARTAQALHARAQQLASWLEASPDASLADVCFTANAGRAHFAHRLALVCADTTELIARLRAWLAHDASARVRVAELPPGTAPAVALAFVQANVAPGAGRDLFAAHPQFRHILEHCDALTRPHLELPLLELLYGPNTASSAQQLQRPCHAHAALVALQWALYELWRAAGVRPAAMYGAGAGEYSAAAAAGVLSWEQALVLATRRGLLHEGLVAGATPKVHVRELKDELSAVQFGAVQLPFVSASHGRAFEAGEVPDASHWVAHLYHEPAADAGAAALLAEGCDVHLDLAPDLPAGGGEGWARWLDALADLYTRGVPLDFRGLDAPFERRKLTLPTYPFERERYWLDFPERSLEPAEPTVIERPSSHPLFASVRVHLPSRGGYARAGSTSSNAGTRTRTGTGGHSRG